MIGKNLLRGMFIEETVLGKQLSGISLEIENEVNGNESNVYLAW